MSYIKIGNKVKDKLFRLVLPRNIQGFKISLPVLQRPALYLPASPSNQPPTLRRPLVTCVTHHSSKRSGCEGSQGESREGTELLWGCPGASADQSAHGTVLLGQRAQGGSRGHDGLKHQQIFFLARIRRIFLKKESKLRACYLLLFPSLPGKLWQHYNSET